MSAVGHGKEKNKTKLETPENAGVRFQKDVNLACGASQMSCTTVSHGGSPRGEGECDSAGRRFWSFMRSLSGNGIRSRLKQERKNALGSHSRFSHTRSPVCSHRLPTATLSAAAPFLSCILPCCGSTEGPHSKSNQEGHLSSPVKHPVTAYRVAVSGGKMSSCIWQQCNSFDVKGEHFQRVWKQCNI